VKVPDRESFKKSQAHDTRRQLERREGWGGGKHGDHPFNGKGGNQKKKLRARQPASSGVGRVEQKGTTGRRPQFRALAMVLWDR